MFILTMLSNYFFLNTSVEAFDVEILYYYETNCHYLEYALESRFIDCFHFLMKYNTVIFSSLMKFNRKRDVLADLMFF